MSTMGAPSLPHLPGRTAPLAGRRRRRQSLGMIVAGVLGVSTLPSKVREICQPPSQWFSQVVVILPMVSGVGIYRPTAACRKG
jgi:hypothetical protein